MESGLYLILLLAAPPPTGGRHPALDSLAASILAMDSIPTGTDLLRMAALKGWVWPLGEVSLLREPQEPEPDSPFWGSGESADGFCLVTAPAPSFRLDPLPPASVDPGEFVELSPRGQPRDMRGAVLSPCLDVIPLKEPGFRAFREGTWWVEFMADTPYGPQVLMLTPVTAGEPGGWPGNGWGRDRIIEGINGLRRKLGIGELRENPVLNVLCGIRARQAGSWGGAFHSFPGSPGTGAMMPPAFGAWAENIATGSTVEEALEMILVSPFHLASCLQERYRFMGTGTVSGGRGATLVIILSEAADE